MRLRRQARLRWPRWADVQVKFSIREIGFFEREVRLRLPFRFGVVTLTSAPQAFVRARIALEDGKEDEGAAAEMLVPKWFDKDPALSNEQNIDQLRASLALARDAYLAAGDNTAFGHWIDNYGPQIALGATQGMNSLTACFGPALIDRALLDALCRALGVSFYEAVRSNLPAIAAVLDRNEEPYQATLDGNEQYASAAGALELWRRIRAEPRLKRLASSIAFIEQPVNRQHALSGDVSALAEEKPVIIDESDDSLEAFPRARRLGYTGVSSKTCKGLYKSLLNAARCRLWNREEGAARYFMSGEDLTLQAGLALQQDLALVSLLGLAHAERNGHHYVNGMAGLPLAEQAAFLEAHPDLYERRP